MQIRTGVDTGYRHCNYKLFFVQLVGYMLGMKTASLLSQQLTSTKAL